MSLRRLWEEAPPVRRAQRILLIGPYDPHCGEYTFLAPPLGVWRLKSSIDAIGDSAEVFDPNCCEGDPEVVLAEILTEGDWDVVGLSTTGMTLRYDLSLAHLVRRHTPHALLVAGGMEATFDPETLFALAPIDLIVLGEGEKPMGQLLERLREGLALVGIPGTAVPLVGGGVQRFSGAAMNRSELKNSIAMTPYAEMPYERYWRRLEEAYGVNGLPFKAEREARLAEIRSVRLITLNYCPMACTFCSSTNFLSSAQGSVAKVARLDAAETIEMIGRIVTAQPRVRSIIFQDDIFVFTSDKRIEDLCARIRSAKAAGDIPADLQFISTNRIDAMTEDRLRWMRDAGFRVLGFGVESFSPNVLKEFNKAQIVPHIESALTSALRLGLTPFLDLILCSPRSSLADVALTVRQTYRWIVAGCEVGLYPYVVPFSGAAMARDPQLKPHTTYKRQRIPGTEIAWDQPDHILPLDLTVRRAMAAITSAYDDTLPRLAGAGRHLPSRTRSLLWVACAIPVLRAAGADVPDCGAILRKLDREIFGQFVRSRDAAPGCEAPRAAIA
jgi:radical SAM superfamily enzyme YgiQ (UPF0313 family)